MTVVPLLYHCYTMVTPWLNPVDYRRVTLPHPTLAPFLRLTSVILLANTEACRSTCRFKSNSEHPKKPSKIATNCSNSGISGASKTTMFFPSCPWRSLTTLLLSPNQALLCHIEAPAEERRDHVFASRGQDRLRHLLHASLAFPGGVFKR